MFWKYEHIQGAYNKDRGKERKDYKGEMRDRRLVDQVMAKTRGSQDDIRSSSGGNDRTSISINTGDSHSGSNSGGEDEDSRKNSDSSSSDTKHVGAMEKKSENKWGAEEKMEFRKFWTRGKEFNNFRDYIR